MGTPIGQVRETDLAEISGIAASRNNPGVLWVHNDRARGQIHAVSTNGTLLATWDLDKALDDLEDIAIGPGPIPELHYLYCGDIGDNPSTRENIRLFRAAEPSVYPYQAANPPTPKFPRVERITLKYPDGSHNAEALLVDPWTGDVYIVTKESGQARVYQAASSQLADGATITLSSVQRLDFDIVSAGDISSDGTEILLRQEDYAEMWKRAPGQSVAQALEQSPVFVPVIGTPREPNGEGIAFAPDGRGYYTISEGVEPPIYFFARTNAIPKQMTESLIAAGESWRYQDDGSDQVTAWRTPAFADANWPSGAGQFGYGEDDERTILRFGSNKDRKHITTYFRKQFQVADPSGYRSLTLRCLFDDGVAVYLNGIEVLRKNLAPDAPYAAAALSAGGSEENLWQTFDLGTVLRMGTNTIAVEVHRYSPSEGDFSFDLQLLGNKATPPLRLSSPPKRISADRFSVDFAGAESAQVFIDRSTNLQEWTALGTAAVTEGTGSFTITISTTPWQFYRVRE